MGHVAIPDGINVDRGDARTVLAAAISETDAPPRAANFEEGVGTRHLRSRRLPGELHRSLFDLYA